VTEGVLQFAEGPDRHPKRTMMALPAVTFNEHERDELNKESLFSQLALELVESSVGRALTEVPPGRAISVRAKRDASRVMPA